MSKALKFLILFGVLSSSAFAADIGCGIDTDFNGSVDQWCTGAFNCTDEDRDGYCTNGMGPNAGIDCNDHDFFDHPGGFYGTNSGCTSNQSKVCNSDGTYSACANFCPSTALACYYIDPVSGSDVTGTGSWANPWKTAAMFSDATVTPSGYHTRQPGDWFIYKGTPTFGDTVSKDGRNVGINLGPSNSGTVSNPIGIAGAPGYWPIFDSTGTASFVAIHDGGQYYKVIGFKVQNSVCNGYTNSVCIAADDGTGDEFANLILTNNSGNDNTGGIMLHTETNSTAHHFIIEDQTQAGGNDDNTAQFLGYRGTGNIVSDFVLSQVSSGSGARETFKVKHADYASDWTIKRFITNNGQLQFGSRRTTLTNGLIFDGKLAFNDPGGTSFTAYETGQYLTIINADSAFYSLAGYKHYNSDGSHASDNCTADYSISDIVFRDSIAQDSRVTGYTDNNRFAFFGLYDSDGMYNETRNSVSLLNSVFYNPNQTVSFGVFEKNNGDTACSTDGGAIKSGVNGNNYTLAGLGSIIAATTSSSVTNPSFSALSIGGCGSCSGKGWNTSWGTGGTPTPTPTPTATPTSPPVNSRRKAQKNSAARKSQ